jgi:hypothetical protein
MTENLPSQIEKNTVTLLTHYVICTILSRGLRQLLSCNLWTDIAHHNQAELLAIEVL